MPKRELKPGEILCPKCDGKGELIGNEELFLNKVCGKCGGSGIVDWVSNAVTRPDELLSVYDTSCATQVAIKSYIDNTKWTLSDDILDDLAKKLTKRIDKEILNEVSRLAMEAEEQNLKQWVRLGEGIIDNGIIS